MSVYLALRRFSDYCPDNDSFPLTGASMPFSSILGRKQTTRSDLTRKMIAVAFAT